MLKIETKRTGILTVLCVAACMSAAAEDTKVVVVASRTRQDINDVAASVTALDEEQIRLLRPIAVDELFKTVPGVDLQGSGFPGSGISLNMRGLTAGYQTKRVLVLVDGRRINEAFQGNAELALLPADSIRKIEVLRGPASALYGSNAMGGVINIVTRRGLAEPVTEMGFLGGSHNTYNFRLGHGARYGAVDYFVNGTFVDTDGYTDNRDGTDRDWAAVNLTANVGYALDEQSELRFFAGFYDAEGADENSDREVQKDYEALEYSLLWDEKRDARFVARAYRNAQDDVYGWKRPGTGFYELETLGAEIQQSMWITERQNVTLGAEFRNDQADTTEITGRIDESSAVFGAYAQDEIHIGDDVILCAGVRVDQSSDYDTETSPRLGLLYRLSTAVEMYGSFNLAHRAPGLSDRFVNVEFMGSRFEGNPDLDPETLTAYELGFRARPAGAVKTEVTAFYNDMRDSFAFMLEPDGVFRVRNVTASRTYGVEGSVDFAVSDSISTFVNGSFTDGEYTEFPAMPAVEGNRLAGLAELKAALGITFTSEHCRHLLQCRYVDDRFGDAQNSAANHLDSYVSVDWRSRVAVADDVDLVVRADNIFDETYQDLPGIEQPGATFMLGAELRF